MPVPAAARRRAARLTAQIAALGFVPPGSVTSRYTRCGKAGCRCMADPPALHGPYLTWTRKVAGKTVTRQLTQDQYAACRPWFEASRKLRALLAELEALSLEIIEAELQPSSPDDKPTTVPPRKTPAT
jgi:uncharacterized protein DUF6788